MTADTPLQVIQGTGGRLGFANMLRKELSLWWSTRAWWLHGLLWLGLTNGLLGPVYYLVQAHPEAPLNLLEEQLSIFFLLGGISLAIGAVVTTQDAVIGERQAGTAAWILSKPVTRSSFILAKFLARVLSLLTLGLLPQSVLAYWQIQYWTGQSLDPGTFALSILLLALQTIFYITLTLALGTFFSGRGAVLGVALAVLFGGDIVTDFLPWLVTVTPFQIPTLTLLLNQGFAVSDLALRVAGATCVWVLFLGVVAVKRFEREEL